MNYNPLKQLIEKQKSDKAIGIYSACSANEYVIEAVLKHGLQTNSCVLIESTANQCDQYGGYTGMTPEMFKNFVLDIAKNIHFNTDKLFLGGDHLGPLTWAHLTEEEAMENAKELIRQYVLAGFSKIHIDTSMKLKNDNPTIRLSDVTIAKRGAILAKVAEETYIELLQSNPSAPRPVYIVGSEVPIPGGAIGTNTTTLEVTRVNDFKNTIATFKKAFADQKLEDAWQQVIAIVVQPGVEEQDDGCVEYDREKAKDLMNAINEYPQLIFEGHSTDYQTKIKLKELVEDGVGILKVGPALTFAMREALFSLAYIEHELLKYKPIKSSYFIEILEKEMMNNPSYWQNHYQGNEQELYLKKKFSFSDRCRYYMPTKEVDNAKNTLIKNLEEITIPLNLLSQFMPIQYVKVREGLLNNDPISLIEDRIINTIDDYLYATNQKELL